MGIFYTKILCICFPFDSAVPDGSTYQEMEDLNSFQVYMPHCRQNNIEYRQKRGPSTKEEEDYTRVKKEPNIIPVRLPTEEESGLFIVSSKKDLTDMDN